MFNMTYEMKASPPPAHSSEYIYPILFEGADGPPYDYYHIIEPKLNEIFGEDSFTREWVSVQNSPSPKSRTVYFKDKADQVHFKLVCGF